jgi:hypothetical protein
VFPARCPPLDAVDDCGVDSGVVDTRLVVVDAPRSRIRTQPRAEPSLTILGSACRVRLLGLLGARYGVDIGPTNASIPSAMSGRLPKRMPTPLSPCIVVAIYTLPSASPRRALLLSLTKYQPLRIMAEKHPNPSDHQTSGDQDQEKDKSFNRANTTDTRATAVSQALPFAPHNAASSKVLEALSSDADHGLSEEDARKRLELYGPNRLKPPKRPSVMKIIVRQVGNAMTLVLSELGVRSDTLLLARSPVLAWAHPSGVLSW